jgi:hypothetical protein
LGVGNERPYSHSDPALAASARQAQFDGAWQGTLIMWGLANFFMMPVTRWPIFTSVWREITRAEQ